MAILAAQRAYLMYCPIFRVSGTQRTLSSQVIIQEQVDALILRHFDYPTVLFGKSTNCPPEWKAIFTRLAVGDFFFLREFFCRHCSEWDWQPIDRMQFIVVLLKFSSYFAAIEACVIA